MWKCPVCGEEMEDQFEGACWKCSGESAATGSDHVHDPTRQDNTSLGSCENCHAPLANIEAQYCAACGTPIAKEQLLSNEMMESAGKSAPAQPPAKDRKRLRVAVLLILVLAVAGIIIGASVSRYGSGRNSAYSTASERTTTTLSVVDRLSASSVSYTYDFWDGYTCELELTIWEMIPSHVTTPIEHPGDTGFGPKLVIEPDVDYDPTTEAVIPYRVEFTNTTQGFDMRASMKLWCKVRPGVTDPTNTPRQVRFLHHTTSGWNTNTFQLANSSNNAGLRLDGKSTCVCQQGEWSDGEPIGSGATRSAVGFIIIEKYYAPAYREGVPTLLSALALYLTPDVWTEQVELWESSEYIELSTDIVPMF